MRSSVHHRSKSCLHNAECKLVTVLFIRQGTIDQEYNALNHGHYARIIAWHLIASLLCRCKNWNSRIASQIASESCECQQNVNEIQLAKNTKKEGATANRDEEVLWVVNRAYTNEQRGSCYGWEDCEEHSQSHLSVTRLFRAAPKQEEGQPNRLFRHGPLCQLSCFPES